MISRLCPHCQQEQRIEAAFCGQCGGKTPLLIEINAAAQYISGCPTFVEFRISNLSQDEITLSRFSATLGGDALKHGIHPLAYPCVLEADKISGLDFRIMKSACGNKILPMRCTIDYRVGDGEIATISGEVSVLVQGAEAGKLLLPATTDGHIEPLDPESIPAEAWFGGFPFGEADDNETATTGIRSLKKSKGMYFCPMPLVAGKPAQTTPESSVSNVPSADLTQTLKKQIMSQVTESVTTSATTFSTCATCSAAIQQQGMYCHDCGAKIKGAVATMIPVRQPTAFCPHCQFALARKFAHCPLDGKAIPFHLEINALSLYMHEVSTKTEFRFHSALPDETVLLDFTISLAEEKLQQGANRLRKDHELNSLGPVLVDALVYPRESNRAEGILGCPPGDTVMMLNVECIQDNHRYTFSANHEITVLSRNTDPSNIVMHLGDVINSGEGSAISTLHNKELNTVEMAQAAIQSNSIGDFIKNMKATEGLRFRPVKFFLESFEALETQADVPRFIDWAPSTKAGIHFESEGRHRNYCILAQSEAVFGRKADSVDVRLVEVEAAMARERESSGTNASVSAVSRSQWHLTASDSGVAVKQLSSLTSRISPGRAHHKDEVIELHVNDYVEIPEVIGLEVLSHEKHTSASDSLYQEAAQILERCAISVPKQREDTPYGAYALARRHSLAPDPPKNLPDTVSSEYYVLLSDWASIGASPSASIQVVGDGIADTHAHLLVVEGFFFIVPNVPRGSVLVNGLDIAPQTPYPIILDDTIVLGQTPLTFSAFAQLRIKA